MSTVTDEQRMSHRGDAHTSKDAASKVATKKALLYGAIVSNILTGGPMTPSEVLAAYIADSEANHRFEWPDADLYDIRRRMSELQYDGRIEPIQVGTHRDGSPQYQTRNGQRVMRLVEETNK